MDIDLANALNWVNSAVENAAGQPLKAPEIVILKGTWRGLTYERMSESSEYSTNYLMRDVAPKLWRHLSNVLGCSVGKTNFRVVLESYVAQSTTQASMFSNDGLAFPLLASPPKPDVSGVNTLRMGASDTASIDRPLPSAQSPIKGAPNALTGMFSDSPLGKRMVRKTLGSSRYPDGLNTVNLEQSPLFDCGYEEELTQIRQWLSPISDDETSQSVPTADVRLVRQKRTAGTQGCLISIWGLKGVGKSLLCKKVVAQLGDRFDAVVWRSLRGKPLLGDFCNDILELLKPDTQTNQRFSSSPLRGTFRGSSHRPPHRPPHKSQSSPSMNPDQDQVPTQVVEQLLSVMAEHSILLIIDSIESVLQPMTLAGDYLAGYSPYREFFQAVTNACSCIVLTGTERPGDGITRSGHYAGQNKRQHSIYLRGLSHQAATTLLSYESLGAPEHWPALIERYQGHPFALRSAARVIREIFNGQVDTFLQQTPSLFTDITRLLTPSFERLSELELAILYWLASQKAPISLIEIQQTLPTPVDSTDLISALDSLKQRACLTIQSTVTPPKFQLPPLVKAYAVHRLLAQFKSGGKSDGSQPSVVSASDVNISATNVISLSEPTPQPIHLSRWLQARFEPAWQPLSQLFETSSTLPSLRLRNTYHLRDETFIKRYKSIPAFSATTGEHLSTTLVVAIRQKDQDLYEMCVQIQPEQGADILPVGLALALIDAQQKTLSVVQSAQADSFIQLPYFQGQLTETFDIQLQLGDRSHTETFLI